MYAAFHFSFVHSPPEHVPNSVGIEVAVPHLSLTEW
jgi:hypothetical protein